jgi:uncharacterized membrane protein YhaH (DUF805 family)
MFGAKYSRLKFWIISISLFILLAFVNIFANFFSDINQINYEILLYIVMFIIPLIWMNTLANRIRDYGNNPWLALFSIIPFVNIGLALYYGIVNSNIKKVAQKNDTNSLTSAVYNHSKDIINGIKPAINEYKETHTSPNNNCQNNNINIDESKIYEDIMIEIEQDSKVKSTWAKALSQSDGNKDKAEAIYIKNRFADIKKETHKDIELEIKEDLIIDSVIIYGKNPYLYSDDNESEKDEKIVYDYSKIKL